MPINKKLLNDLVTKTVKAAQGGPKLDIKDPEEVGQYVIAILALGTELIPLVGSSVSALTTLFGQLLFSPNSTEKIWDKLRPRIEQMIDSKIEELELEHLRASVHGLESIFKRYHKNVLAYQNTLADKASTEEDKRDARDTLKDSHISTGGDILNAIAEFRIKRFAVAALPLFVIAANFYLVLLKDGIEHGKEWGYAKRNIEDMRTEFKSLTTFQEGAVEGVTARDIQQAEIFGGLSTFGVPPIAAAYENLKAVQHGVLDTTFDSQAYQGLDFVSYVKVVYARGRLEVKTYTPLESEEHERGHEVVSRLKAYSDYDSLMIMNATSYAELWPHLLEKEIPQSALERLDREVYFGPFGRYGKNAKWDDFAPPTIVPRNPDQSRVTAVHIRGFDDVSCIQMRYGNTWGESFGDREAGQLVEVGFERDEYVKAVTVEYGHKIGRVKFMNNKNREVTAGGGKHSHLSSTIAPPGYQLTSVYVTNYEKHPPIGCEGIILGFRPVVMDMALDL